MTFDIDCEIKFRKDGEVIVDPRRAQLLKRISELGSLDQAAKEIGLSLTEAESWLDTIKEATGVPAVVLTRGKADLTDGGRSLLAEYETRSHVALSQVQNLWRKPWVTTDGIVVIDDRVVLIKRGREPFKGMYALPGGIVDYGESVEQCVVREIEEETGLRTRVLDLVGSYSVEGRDPRGHFITLAYNLQPIGGSLHGGDDAAEAVLFPLDGLPELAADHRMILADAMLKRDQCRSKTDRNISGR